MLKKGVWVCTIMLLVSGCSMAWMEGEQEQKDVSVPAQTVPDEAKQPPAQIPFSMEFTAAEYAIKPGGEGQLEINLYDEKGNTLITPPNDELHWIHVPNDHLEVLADGSIIVSEDAPIGHSFPLTAEWNGLTAETIVRIWASAEETIQSIDDESIPAVTNAYSTAVMVNKQRSLPEDFIPENLTVPDVPFSFSGEHEKQLLQEEAARALEQLFQAASADEIELYAVSGYRSYDRQKAIFQHNIATQGEEVARQFSAAPGTSEHQTGLAMDVSSPVVQNRLTQQLGDTIEGQWLVDHAHEYGFIIRYPRGKEAITGYAWEPWHLRYVGLPLAQDMKQRELTMEEYFSDPFAVPVLAPS